MDDVLADFGDLSRKDKLVLLMLLQVRDKRVEFATKYHRNTRGERMNFTNNPYLPQVYNSMSKTLVLQGSVQSKKSEFIVVDHFAQAACGLSVFFCLPKVELRTSYVQNRIDKRISEVPEYRKLIKSGAFDNSVMKNFGKGVIKYVGSNVLSDFKEFPGDSLIVEEVDQCSDKNVEYGRDRLRASPYQFRRYVGNPTLKGVGINKYFLKSSQNMWHIPCRCGEVVKLDWFETVMDLKYDDDGNPVDFSLKDTDWRPGCGRDIFCLCPKCGHPIDRADPNGLWIPDCPDNQDEGYLMTMLNSWENSVADMFDEWKDAWEDTGGMEHFWNSNLGLPYSMGSSRITIQTLRRASSLVEPYNFVIKKDCAHVPDDRCEGKCSMGIDVGKNFDVRISEVLPSGARRAVFIGKVGSRYELIQLGIRYNVYCAVIDSMPEYRTVLDLQEEAPFFVWSCRYDSEGKDKRPRRDKKTRTIHTDRTVALDRGLAEFKSGLNYLPKNFEQILGGQYKDEMMGPVRQEEQDRGGNIRMVWSKCKDHARHADVYDLLASQFCASSGLDGICVG